MSTIINIKSISQLHKILNCAPPKHPLISVINYEQVDFSSVSNSTKFVTDFYTVSLKKLSSGSNLYYGRKHIDFDDAAMLCMSPGQVITMRGLEEGWYAQGWGLYFHPDLIRNSFLNKKIKAYNFFNYSDNEALHISDNEKLTIQAVLNTIQQEYSLNIDVFSHDLIVSNIEVFLNYLKRFYGRQFITRASYHSDIIIKFDNLLRNYFKTENVKTLGTITVKYCAEKLALSPNYLSDLLKQETGKTAIEHIHYNLIETAKDLLLNTNESISSIAYDLGFEQPQNFSRLFKKKTGESPKEYRTQLN